MARTTSRQGTKPFSASTSAPEDRKSRPKPKKDKSQSAYTYLPSLPKRHRTSAQTLSLSRDEAELGKSRSRKAEDGEDSDDDMEKRIRKVAMMIAEDGPGGVESDESDVDSDEAWEDEGSDEERWGDVFRDLEKGKKAKKGGKQVEERVLKVSCEVLNREMC